MPHRVRPTHKKSPPAASTAGGLFAVERGLSSLHPDHRCYLRRRTWM